MATTIASPATTTAIVTTEGLALSPTFMAELNLKPGTEICVTLTSKSRDVPQDIERLIKETRGMLAHLGGGMAEELIAERSKDELLYQSKKW